MPSVRTINVFLSSPTDVFVEREAAARVLARVGAMYQKHLAFALERWESHFYEATRSFQETISAMDGFDLVIGILWKRIGTELPPNKFRRLDGSTFESGTVYELESALAAGAPPSSRPNVYIFRKSEPVFFSSENVDEERRQKEALDGWVLRIFHDALGHHVAGSNTFSSVDDFEDKFEVFLITWIKERGLVPRGLAWDYEQLKLSPYPGLIPYDKNRENVYFGRSYAIQEARESLLSAVTTSNGIPCLFVIGASGSGKSSLVRAGLLPSLTQPGIIPGISLWRCAITEPSTKSIRTLAERLFRAVPELTKGAQPTVESWASLAERSPEAAAETVTWALRMITNAEQQRTNTERSSASGLILVVDQLESLFGTAEESSYATLLQALAVSQRVWIILTVRSDRYAELQQASALLFLKKSGATYDLPPPGPGEIADIIMGPARAAGLEFEKRDGIYLLDTIRKAIPNSDALPLLQMTLAQLFEARTEQLLTLDAYNAIGGLEGAIAAHANAVFSNLSIPAQKELSNILRVLIRDVSRRADGSIRFTPQSAESHEIVKNSPRSELVENFVNGRLLIRDGETIRVAHEALLRRWRPASNVLEALADAELRKSRLRLGLASAAALIFMFVAIVATFLYERSNANLSLASRAKADQFVAEDMPAKALLLATNVRPSIFAPVRRALSGAGDEEAIRLNSIAEVAGPAVTLPKIIATDRAGATSVDVSADGKQIIVGYASGELVLVRPTNTTRLLLNEGSVQAVRFSAHEARIFVVTETKSLTWDFEKNIVNIICQGKAEVTGFALSQNGKDAAWSTKDKSVLLINTTTGSRQRFTDHSEWALSVSFSGNGDVLVSAGADGKIVVRSLLKSKVLVELQAQQKDLWSVAASFDGTYVAAASVSGPVTIWKLGVDGKILSTRLLPMVGSRRWKVRFSPEDRVLAVASWDGSVSFFDPADLRYLGKIDGNDQRVNELAFTPDSKSIITASNSGVVKQWDVGKLRPMFYDLSTGAPEIITAVYSPDGKRFLAGANNGFAGLYDVEDDGRFRPKCSIASGRWIRGVAFTHDSRTGIILKALEGLSNREAPIVAFNTEDCKYQNYENLPTGGDVTAISTSLGSARLAWATSDGKVYLYDLNLKSGPQQFDLPVDKSVTDISFGHDEDYIFIGTLTGSVYMLNLTSGAVQEFKGPTQSVNSVTVSPDGKLVVAGGKDSQIFVWYKNQPDKALQILDIPGGTNKLAFSPDGKMLAAGSDALYLVLWNVESWRKDFLWYDRVGIRSVFGFHPRRLDLAFDGAEGVLRVLPHQDGNTQFKSYGSVVGVEPSFDTAVVPRRGEIELKANVPEDLGCLVDAARRP